MAGSAAGSIYVDLLLRDSQFRPGINRARNDTKQFSDSARKDLAGTRQAFLDVINPVSNLSSAIRSLGVSIASFLSVQKVVELSDQYRQLSSRLSIVVTDTEQFRSVQEDLYDIAIRTRQPLEGIYNLYTRLAQALPESQRSQFNLLEIVESINQALAITGEGSAQASSAILQFTQAASSGFQASGQEINALLDSAPRLAQALQKSFGDGTKSLKKLSEDGDLSLQAVLSALEKTSGEAQKLSDEFSKTEITVTQSLTNLQTAFTKFIGENDGVSSFTLNFARGINNVANGVAVLNDELDRLSFNLDVLKSKGGDFTEITPQMFANALPPEYNQFSDAQMQAAIDQAARLEDQFRNPKETSDQKKAREKAEREAAQAAKEIESLYNKNREAITGLDQATLQYNDRLVEYQELLDAGRITQEEFNRSLQWAQEEFDKTRENVGAFGIDLEQFGKRAAENIQDAFADFLFDPFDQGLDGMAKGFVDTIRKMIAEAQAAQLAKALFGEMAGGEEGSGGLFGGLLSGLGNIFGGGGASIPASAVGQSSVIGNSTAGLGTGIKFFADGGYLGPGQWGIAGEKEAELIYGGRTGASIFNQDQMGRSGNTYNIDARGADEKAIVRLEQSLLALAGPGVIEQRVSTAQSRGSL